MLHLSEKKTNNQNFVKSTVKISLCCNRQESVLCNLD